MSHVQNPTHRQHYLPCCYLQFFSLAPEGQKSWVYLFNGKICTKVQVKTQGYAEYTYSLKDPQRAEDFFKYNFEDGYPPIARKIIAGERLTADEKNFLLVFAFITRFRSPAYVIRGKQEERIDLIQYIMGSALNEIERLTPADWKKGNEHKHMNRVCRKYSLKIVESEARIWVSDNPVTIHEHAGTFAAMVMMPVSPTHTAVFYQRHLMKIRSRATPKDIRALFITQRDTRIKNLYYSVDAKQALRPGRKFPSPAKNRSAITRKKVIHHHRFLHNLQGEPIFDFVVFK